MMYRQHAIEVIWDDPDQGRFEWLIDGMPERIGTGGRLKKSTILVELGRIDDDNELIAVALKICELKPKTRDAIAMIRRYRTGASPAGDFFDLALAIERTLRDYAATHPSISLKDVKRALLEIAELYAGNETDD
jgi:hypothetical protein